MLLKDREISLTSIGEDKYLTHLKGITVEINKQLYDGLTIIFRLLTFAELKVIDRMIPDTKDSAKNAGAISGDLEEDIFFKCVHHIFGIGDVGDIELDELEAGVISTVSGLILGKSYQHVTHVTEMIDRYKSSVSVIDSIQLMVCKHYNTSLEYISKLPIDELFKKYATIDSTLPGQGLKFTDPNEQAPPDKDE